MYLGHTDVAFRLVVDKRNIWVRQEQKHLVFMLFEAVQKASGLALSSHLFLRNCSKITQSLMHSDPVKRCLL